jgi:Tfp pilus assembly protein PilF
VDNGVNMLYRWREGRDKSRLILTRSVGKSVIVCCLTTIAGFVALIPASHHGISTLDLVLALGGTQILIATVLVLPALMRLIGTGLEARAKTESLAKETLRRIGGDGVNLAQTVGTIAVVIFMLVATLGYAATAANEKRARSDEVVNEAEAIIIEAGKKDTLDSAMVNHAIDDLHQALKIDPQNDTAYVDLGFCYGMLGDPKRAADMYRTATMINPSPDNFKELADLFLRAGNGEAALMAANTGLQKAPHDARLLNAKGLALNVLHRPKEAAEAFREAVRYDPKLEVARQNLDAVSGKAMKTAQPAQ